MRLKRVLVSLLAAGSLVSALSTPAHAEWPPPHRPPVCAPDTWKAHKTGPCGWHTVPNLINKVFGVHAPRARCIAWRESRDIPWKVNPSTGAAGLFQFMPFHWRGKWNPLNPVVNTLHAWALSLRGTRWSPWYPLGTC